MELVCYGTLQLEAQTGTIILLISVDRKICSHKCITILNPWFYSLLGLQECLQLTKDTHAMVTSYVKIKVPYILSSGQ